MRVRDLPLDDVHVAHFEQEGIDELYPPQAAAVDAGVCAGENVVAAVPTASGKTFIAELGLLSADGPGLYICPLRALAREKHAEFDRIPDIDVAIATGDYDTAAEELGGRDVVVATSEKVDSAIRNGASWIDSLGCVVIDEVHLLGTPGRGPTLEVTLATLQRRAAEVQTVALSATIENPDAIAEWLGASLVESDWRPVDLRTGVYAAGTTRFDDGTVSSVDIPTTASDAEADTEATVALAREAVAGGGQALAFVSSRRKAEQLADRLAEEQLATDAGIEREAAETAEAVRESGTTAAGDRLARCAAWGVAFHHAGLRSNHRSLVEDAFRDRRLAVICATPTLAAGVNVPARRVIVRDQRRFTGTDTEWLPTLEVHQMCGRAGRPGLDPYGEAILVGEPDTQEALWERYVQAGPERIESQLRDPTALRTHTLALVASAGIESQAGLLDRLSETFYAARTPNPDLGGVVGDAIADLIEMELLEAPAGDAGLAATPLGEQVTTQYVIPETGVRIRNGLRQAATMDPDSVTRLTVLEIVCDTPDMQDTYLGSAERADVYRFARERSNELTTDMADAENFENWLESVKTARVLAEWADGTEFETLVERHGVGPGDLESRLERVEWLLGAAKAIAEIEELDVPVLVDTYAVFERDHRTPGR